MLCLYLGALSNFNSELPRVQVKTCFKAMDGVGRDNCCYYDLLDFFFFSGMGTVRRFALTKNVKVSVFGSLFREPEHC